MKRTTLPLILFLLGTTLSVAASPPEERGAGAWDRSLALERRGDLGGARTVLTEAYSERPEGYEVSLRLAWLALRLREAQRAVDGYRRAATLAGAGREASEGLRSALVLSGAQALTRGEPALARRFYREALALDGGDGPASEGLLALGPERGVSPAIWGGYLGGKLGGSWSSAALFVLQVPAKLSDHLHLRATYRHVQPLASSASAASTPIPPYPLPPGVSPPTTASSSTSLFGRQDELFGAIGLSSRLASAELHGFAAFPSGSDAVPGLALGVRVGWRWGVSLETSALEHAGGWNYQIQPSGFYWPTDWIGIAAGSRLTWDPAGFSASGQLGGTLLLGSRLRVELEAHLGEERWPLSLSGPTLLAIDATFAGGVSVTASLRVHRELTLSLQLQGEQLSSNSSADLTGSYLCVAAGLRWSPTFTWR